MLEILLSIFSSGSVYTYDDPCKRSLDSLNIEQKIEMSIGCSTVNGRRTYSDSKLYYILEDK